MSCSSSTCDEKKSLKSFQDFKSTNDKIIDDIENCGNIKFITSSYDNIYKNCTKENAEKCVIEMCKFIENGEIKTKHQWTFCLKKLQKTVGIVGVVPMIFAYLTLISQKAIKPSKIFREFARSHTVREDSGIISVSVMTSPNPLGQEFSCQFDCAMCPNQPGSTRSYITDGPTAARGLRNDYDPIEQMNERLLTLFLCGHDVDKLEVLVLGGTWNSYPVEYQEWFITRLYYASNTFFDDKTVSLRDVKSLEEEKLINESTVVKIIGLTLETRPDQINETTIKQFLNYGCTRIQLGVQHTDDLILKKINRQCYLKDTIRALRNLKDNCFKVDIHIMPQLPDATVEDDIKMFKMINDDPDLQADQLKIYPCETTPWTKIEKWFLDGSYVPYPNEDMIRIVINHLTVINPWVRINRLGRDALPSHAIAGNPLSNLGQVIYDKMDKEGLVCQDMRTHEVGSKTDRMKRIDEAELRVRQYEASNGQEFHLSFETPEPDNSKERVLFGFCRLRLSHISGHTTEIFQTKEDGKLKENEVGVNAVPMLNNCALLRELHVYGRISRVDGTDKTYDDLENDLEIETGKVQHRGFGSKLLKKAEEIAFENGYKKMAIISGVGVRNYYRKFGYELEGAYMCKILKDNNQTENILGMELSDILIDMNFNMNLFAVVLILYCIVLIFTHF